MRSDLSHCASALRDPLIPNELSLKKKITLHRAHLEKAIHGVLAPYGMSKPSVQEYVTENIDKIKKMEI